MAAGAPAWSPGWAGSLSTEPVVLSLRGVREDVLLGCSHQRALGTRRDGGWPGPAKKETVFFQKMPFEGWPPVFSVLLNSLVTSVQLFLTSLLGTPTPHPWAGGTVGVREQAFSWLWLWHQPAGTPLLQHCSRAEGWCESVTLRWP